MTSSTDTARISHTVILEDTTLRDGEQAPGVALDENAKLAYFHRLCDAGLQWIEAGIPAMGGSEKRALARMLYENPGVNLFAWNRGVLADVKESLDMGFRHVHIGLPTSGAHLKYSVRKDKDWLFQTARAMIMYAKDRGAYVSISAEDVGRTTPDMLQEYAALVHDAGADRLRLSDTVGILDPAGYAAKVRAVRAVTPIALQCHCHNDFGLGVANTLAGLEAGATFFHATVNGIGERAGMPDLGACVMALHHFHKLDLGVDKKKLRTLSSALYEAIAVDPRAWQPVVGRNIFAHESGIHVNGTLNNNAAFEPMPPELVGGERRIVIGKHSGAAAIRYRLHAIGIDVSDESCARVLPLVREQSAELGRELSSDELSALYQRERAAAGVQQ